jgi:ATP diphosphatase
MTQKHTFSDLVQIMAKLRDPHGGCPWDLQQDFKSIAPYTIEEAYEVADAIERNNMNDLREELGDLLLQPVYHAQMASESGEFTIDDVIHDICAKMIYRHPHVFGNEAASSPEDVNAIWDNKKQEEQSNKRHPSESWDPESQEKLGSSGRWNDKKESILDNIPQNFPALLRAHKLQKKAAKVGFEWNDITGVLDKLKEELAELEEAQSSGNKAEIAEELGDVLFVLANYARMNDLNAEDIMRAANNKFEKRFRYIESQIPDLENATLEQMEEKWQEAKKL